MEHALFVSDPQELKFFKMRSFKRIYFGNEFCEHQLPSARQLESVMEFARSRGVDFTLVTPVLYEPGLERARSLIRYLPPGAEVVFNDFGIIEDILSQGLIPVHGRMLMASIRDPRVDGETEFQEYFKSHNLQAPYLEMLNKRGVSRVEIDNPKQGYDVDSIAGMDISIYYPFVHFTVTRKCVFANLAVGSSGTGFVRACSRKCDNKVIPADIDGTAISIMGNAQFYRNDAPPPYIDRLEIDRLVYMPVFPNYNSGVEDLGFLEWSHPYQTGEYANSWGTEPDETMRRLIGSVGLKEGARVLDSGCGAGRNAPFIIDAGFNYTGIDIAPEAIELARKNNPGATLITGNLLEHDWADRRFDAVMDYGCFHTLAPWQRKRYFDVIDEILMHGGILIVAGWDADDSAVPMEYVCGTLPEWGCSQQEFERIAAPRFALRHTEKREEGKWFLRYYLMRKTG